MERVALRRHAAVGPMLSGLMALMSVGPVLAMTAHVEESATPLLQKNFEGTWAYTYGFWINGWRRNRGVCRPAILAIEASAYDLALTPADLTKLYFQLRKNATCTYGAALGSDPTRFEAPANTPFILEIKKNGRTYRALSATAGGFGDTILSAARQLESGQYVQHFDFAGLSFKSADGESLSCDATLDLVAWPDSVTFTLQLTPQGNPWLDTTVRMAFAGTEITSEVAQKTAGSKAASWAAGDTRSWTLNVPLGGAGHLAPEVKIAVGYPGNPPFPVVFEAQSDCYVARVTQLKRPADGLGEGKRGYDDFAISVDNPGQQAREVPFLLDLRRVGSITGLCPILCDRAGRPTGIPVQLSKNWHHGEYLMGYTQLAAKPGHSEYLLRIAYGFYGTLPSASHAQLSLVGYSHRKNGNGRWDQLAIGSWGETFCLDMDMSLTRVAICDVRMLMARNGLNGKKWDWTDAGWGGDWLGITTPDGEKLSFNSLKTAYLSHGPCLTDARYAGFYGNLREVTLEGQVHTWRTDDFARTVQKLKYTFNTPVKTQDAWLYKMGGTPGQVTPVIAFGNGQGLIQESQVPASLAKDALYIDKTELSGKGPWWVSFPGAWRSDPRNWGTGYRALVIRSYKARLGGKDFTHPTFAMPVHAASGKNPGVNLNLLLVAPAEVREFSPQDTVEMNLEWITLPRVADDYYGPNESFRSHVTENPNSWKTTWREAHGNDLQVAAQGGRVLERLPIVIETQSLPVSLEITGGVGYVPLRFHGLKTADVKLFELIGGKEVPLDQSVKGNDFWQVDSTGGTFSVVYNLPLDGKSSSKWILR